MNAITLLKQDHGNVETLFKRFEAFGEDADPVEKRAVVDHITEQLSVHAAIEEQLFYPAVREAIDDAKRTVLEALEEHHLVKTTLAELERTPPASERFDAKLTVLIENVRHHVQEEEDELFPKVREAIPGPQLDELGTAMEQAKATAPTRAHPHMPDVPPLNVILGNAAAVVDRALQTSREAVATAFESAGKVLGRS